MDTEDALVTFSGDQYIVPDQQINGPLTLSDLVCPYDPDAMFQVEDKGVTFHLLCVSNVLFYLSGT